MSATASATASQTFTKFDIEKVVRRVTADLVMIASSSGAITEKKAAEYGHDIDVLAQSGYLHKVDVTLFGGGIELQAVCFYVNESSGELTTSRPGGVLWPRVTDPYLRVILHYTDAYTDAARATTKSKLIIPWTATDADTSHSTLTANGGRDYVSNGYGMQRKDWK